MKRKDYFYGIFIWLFPLYLIFMEFFFRKMIGVGSASFIGPSVAVTGIGFLIPLIKPKEISELNKKKLTDGLRAVGMQDELVGVSLLKDRDQTLIPIIWFFIFISFFVWLWACYSSEMRPKEIFYIFGCEIPEHISIGFINYFIACAFSGLKHKV